MYLYFMIIIDNNYAQTGKMKGSNDNNSHYKGHCNCMQIPKSFTSGQIIFFTT